MKEKIQEINVQLYFFSGLYINSHQKVMALIDALQALNFELSKDELAEMYNRTLFF